MVITTASGLICLVIGLYVFLKGRRQMVNTLFFLICIFMAIWCLGEAMTMAASNLAGKTFWTRFQGLGEMPLIPTYLLLAHYFTHQKFLRDRRKSALLIVSLYVPWLLGLVLLYTTGIFYSSYYLIEQGQGVNVVRTPFFWFLTALGFAEILAATVLYLRERSRTSSKVARKGLLILALAPVPMLIVNIVMNLELSLRVTTPQAGLLFIIMVAYGILRYGLFVDIRSMTRNMLAHALVMTGNLIIFTSLCMFYIYGLDMGFHWTTYILFVLAGIPFMIGYHAELEWARKFTGRYIYGREFEEGRLLQELGSSIRTVSNVGELAESVVGKVRESMGLSACALMMAEDGGYRVVGYAADDRHPAGMFNDTVKANTHMLGWENAYSTYSDGDRFSTYWTIGNRIYRGQCVLEFIDRGILRTYEGDGRGARDNTGGRRRRARSSPSPWRSTANGWDCYGSAASWTVPVSPWRSSISWSALSTQLAVSLLNSKLMQELLDKSARLQKLIHSTSSAQEEERIRISRELHDGLAPYFLDFIFRLDMLEAQVAGFPRPFRFPRGIEGEGPRGLEGSASGHRRSPPLLPGCAGAGEVALHLPGEVRRRERDGGGVYDQR